MKIYPVLAVCTLLPALCIAQGKTDSLKISYRQALQKARYEDAAYRATLVGNELTMSSQYDSAIEYYYAALRLSKRRDFVASTLNSLGVAFNYKGYPDSSIKYYKKALESYRVLNDTLNEATIEVNLAIVYKNLGWYDEALETSFQALNKMEKTGPGRTVASIYSTIGLVYLLTGDAARSIQYHKRSLEIRRRIGFDRGVGQSLTNIGEALVASKHYDSALVYLFDAARIKRQNENQSELGSTLNLIGQVYLMMDKLTAAEQPLFEALAIKAAVGERASQAAVMNNIARLKIKQGRIAEAEKFLVQGEGLLRKSGDLGNLKDNLELEIELQEAMRNPSKALLYAQELIKVKDSLLNGEKADIILAMETRYETQKKEKQILELEKDKLKLDASVEDQKRSILILMGFVTVALGFGFFIYRQNRSLRAARDLNRLLLKEVNHRVKNNLQIISTLFRVPYQGLDEGAIRLIKSGESRVNAMALIHKQLSEETSYRAIQLDSFIAELASYLDRSFNFSTLGGHIRIICPKVEVDVERAVPLSLIINELLGNALKHAAATEIVVEVVQEGRALDLRVTDNGVGLRDDASNGSEGFGLRLIAMMVKELRGTIETKNLNGTQTRINVPML